MPQIINTNIASLNAQRNLNASQRDQESALQRLSSGLRINSAKDDAAGLAISTRFDSQIRGTSVAVRNAGDAISLAQTAEGALDSINTSLQRIRELALQSANDTNTTLDRQALQEEVDQLIDEIEVVSTNANFNGKKLLDGSFTNAVFQTGANVGDTISVSVSKVDTSSLGAAQKSGVSSANRFTTTAGITSLANGDLTINGVAIGGAVASDDQLSNTGKTASAISLAATINKQTDLTGVTATVNANVVSGGAMTPAALTGTITINGVTTSSISTTTSGANSRSAVVTGINAIAEQTGVRAVDTGEDATGVQLIADDGRNITLTGTTLTAAATGIRGLDGTSDTQVGSVTLRSADGSEIEIGGDTSLEAATGFVRGSYSGNTAQAMSLTHSVAAGAAGSTVDLSSGDLVINGVTIGGAKASDDTASDTSQTSSSKAGSSIAIAAAINRVSSSTGVQAVVNANTVKGTSTTTGTAATDFATITVNGFATDQVTSVGNQALDRAAAAEAINRISGQTGVVAVDKGDGLELTAADGRNISVIVGSAATDLLTASDIGLNGASGVVTSAAAVTAAVGDTAYGTVTLVSGGKISVSAGSNNVTQLELSGFRAGDYGDTKDGQFIKDVDITTAANAEKAITSIDNAINSVASVRAQLGAVQNRFQNTISNLETSGENLSSANSRIRDADFATETAELSRSQVLQQAGISVLAQANARPQQVLSLLQ